MPEPKLSAVLNNCPVHALTPEIKAEIINFAEHEDHMHAHNAQYERLKNTFAVFYDIPPATFSWAQWARILTGYNAFDIQIIMGPVLRLFMKEQIASNELTPYIAEAAGLDFEAYINHLTEVNPATARYLSLSPDELFTYVSAPLGLSLQYQPEAGAPRTLPVDQALATVHIYHQGGLEGAQAGGHWERTAGGTDSIDYQPHDDTQLESTLPLLGQDPALNPYGFAILKKHVKLTLNDENVLGVEELSEQFAELALTSAQIEKYIFNVTSVPKALAIELLGSNLTEDTEHFIAHYDIVEIPAHQLYENYIRALPENKPLLHASEEAIVARLLEPVTLPEATARRLAAFRRVQLEADEPEANVMISAEAAVISDTPPASPPNLDIDRENAVVHNPTTPSNRLESPNTFIAKKNFVRQLETLAAKRDELLRRHETTACEAAAQLYNGLRDAGVAYFDKPPTEENYHLFKRTCDTFLASARPVLEEHRGWKQVLGNVALAILGLGIGYLLAAGINKAITGKFLFFKTDSAEKVDAIEESIKHSGPAAGG